MKILKEKVNANWCIAYSLIELKKNFAKSSEHEINPYKANPNIEVNQSSSNKSNQKLLRIQEARRFTRQKTS